MRCSKRLLGLLLALTLLAACSRDAPAPADTPAPAQEAVKPSPIQEEPAEEAEEAAPEWSGKEAQLYLVSALSPLEGGEPAEGVTFKEAWSKTWDPSALKLFKVEDTDGALLLQGKAPRTEDVAELLVRLEEAPGVTEVELKHSMNDETSVLFEASLTVPTRSEEFRARLLDARAQVTGLEGGLNPVTVNAAAADGERSEAEAPELGWELIGIIQTRTGRKVEPKAWLRDSAGLAHQFEPGQELEPGVVLLTIDAKARGAIVMRTREGQEPLQYVLRVTDN